MSIIQQVDRSGFHAAFRAYRRENFSPRALDVLFEYLENYSEDACTDVTLDVIELCCDWSEYDSALDAANEYGFDAPEGDGAEGDEAEAEALARGWLEDRTTVLVTGSGGVVIMGF